MTRRILARLLAPLALALLAGASPALAQDVVLIPNRVIYPGETLELAILREVTLKPGKVIPPAVAVAAAQLEGKVAKRTLLPGRYIPEAALREAWVVEQGTPVQVMFVSGSLVISATAVTLQSGAAGDIVRVRNLDSGKTFSGIVMGDGTVRVGAS
ncbi:flagellar basal body P-ring formation chaperone FlgA [Mesorhizobium marinum]|uniref:Flagella basal body P-ring formation protein FlgA n=1 Tax=Mesorhizobium marinum TaxID=3228790 RepID=A0ABV3QUY7_9HYPH